MAANDQKVTYIIDAKNLLSKVFDKLSGEADAVDKKISGIGKGGVGGGGKTGMLGSIIGGNLISGAISKSTSALYDFGKESVSAFAKFEQFGVALTTMFHGNRAEAKGLSDELVQFAKSTPFELTEIQDATKQLIAYGSTSQGVGKELKMLGDISSGVGAPIGEIAYLYGTARTQGRLFARDIYQLSGRGISIVAALAKQFKVSESAVMGLVEKGKVGFPEMQKALADMTKEGGQFFNMMDAQSQTLAGKWSNLMDAVGQLQTKLAENKAGLMGGLVDWSQKFLNNLVASQQIINDLQTSNKLSKTDNQNWFERNFHMFGRDITANKENLQMDISARQENAMEALQEKNFQLFEIHMKKLSEQADKDAQFLGVGAYKGMIHGSSGGGKDKRGFNEEEVQSELGMISLAVNALKSKAELIQAGKRKAAAALLTGGEGGDKLAKGLGTGTTIENQAPKNMYITINGGLVNTMEIHSVDGAIPTAKMKEQVSRILLETLNDAHLAQR